MYHLNLFLGLEAFTTNTLTNHKTDMGPAVTDARVYPKMEASREPLEAICVGRFVVRHDGGLITSCGTIKSYIYPQKALQNDYLIVQH